MNEEELDHYERDLAAEYAVEAFFSEATENEIREYERRRGVLAINRL